jgi:hypothetical protein
MGQNKVTALITIFLTFILFVILQPGDDPMALVRIASIVAAVVIVLIVIYTHFLWRVEPFTRFHHIVDISGKWEGKLPILEDKEIPIEVKIKQYYDDVYVELITDHNHSESLVTKIVNEVDGSKLYIVYKCKPTSKVESKDDIDYGTIMLRLDEDILEGEYFNSKNISGHIELYRKE